MKKAEFDQLTTTLTNNLNNHPDVLGLVACGSMADQDYRPDPWSDHDFFVIVKTGTQSQFKQDLSWLPYADQIVLSFQETEHGMKVLYRFGHLLEFAVFAEEDLDVVRLNRFATLIDKAAVDQVMTERARETAVSAAANPTSDHSLLGQFLANIFVGVGRYARGEQISGRIFVNTYAVGHLLKLLTRHFDAPEKSVLDNLDPYRRFERVYPEIGRQLNGALNRPTLPAASALLSLSETLLSDKISQFPHDAVMTIRNYIDAQIF
ncbi:MAG: hypothetical protein KC419_14595 [Anaerolineales bacterium]|nr:hypothetical protein [Anaerolineales bacterium]